MSELQTLIDNLKQARQNKKTELDVARKAAKGVLEGYMLTLFNEIPELTSVVVKGWTMGFNDGEPCYHQQGTPIVNGFDDDRGEQDEEQKRLPRNSEQLVENLCNLLEETFELAFETNFQVTFTRVGRKVKMDNDCYDCGY